MENGWRFKMPVPICKTPKTLSKEFKNFKHCFTKPQYEHAKTYVTGLIVSDDANIQDISGLFVNGKHQSSLNRFITKSPWDPDEVNARRLELIKRRFKPRKSGLLIVDDSLSHKTGKSMEGADWHHDTLTNRVEFGHSIVTSHYTDNTVSYPLFHDVYTKEKTKLELALDQVKRAKEAGFDVETAVIDSWYFGRRFVKELRKSIPKWVSVCKRNRKVKVDDEKLKLGKFIDSIPRSKYKKLKIGEREFFVFEQQIYLPSIGETKLVLSREKRKKKIKPIVTNHLNWSAAGIIETYLCRWRIEDFYRDAKQSLGLEDYQVRSLRGVVIHLCLVFLAYTLLILSRSRLVLWLREKLETIGDMCRYVIEETLQGFVEWVIQFSKARTPLGKVLKLLDLTKTAKV